MVKNLTLELLIKGQSWCFMFHTTARVILGQALSIVTSESRTHTEVTACD